MIAAPPLLVGAAHRATAVALPPRLPEVAALMTGALGLDPFVFAAGISVAAR